MQRPVSTQPAVDPRVAIVSLSVVVVAALVGPSHLRSMSALLVYVAVVTVALGGGVGRLGVVAKRLAPFFVIIIALNGLAVTGEAVTVFGRRVVSREGVIAGVFFSSRLAVMALAAAALVRMAPPERFALGAHALARPFSPRLARSAAFHGFLAMSFVPLFAGELERIRVAQSFRGASLGGGLRRRLDSVRLIVVPLLLSAIYRSGQLAMVVELRDIRRRFGRGVALAPPRASDLVFLASTLIVVVAAFLLG